MVSIEEKSRKDQIIDLIDILEAGYEERRDDSTLTRIIELYDELDAIGYSGD